MYDSPYRVCRETPTLVFLSNHRPQELPLEHLLNLQLQKREAHLVTRRLRTFPTTEVCVILDGTLLTPRALQFRLTHVTTAFYSVCQ